MKRSNTQYNKDAGKEIILLKYTSTMTPTAHARSESRMVKWYCGSEMSYCGSELPRVIG